ncbi:uncharacterized protein LOC119173582 isoform X2 [Rhipicephalus microplus]|uniref:uncharacterized protein LOC119173582 isoform X2 n=1 Tax=Rhipicephalus microplus TaxID=6941 RepID=UPI003F6CBA96
MHQGWKQASVFWSSSGATKGDIQKRPGALRRQVDLQSGLSRSSLFSVHVSCSSGTAVVAGPVSCSSTCKGAGLLWNTRLWNTRLWNTRSGCLTRHSRFTGLPTPEPPVMASL